MRALIFFALALFAVSFSGCLDSGGVVQKYTQVTLYNLDRATSKVEAFKLFNINEPVPFARFMHNSQRIVAANNTTFYFVEPNASDSQIAFDTIQLENNSFFDISPDNERIVFAGVSAVKSTDAQTTFKNRGLYQLSLATNKPSIVYVSDDWLPQYPVYSKDGKYIGCRLVRKAGSNSRMVIMNTDGTNLVEVDASTSDVLRYGQFSNDSKYFYYFLAPDKILEYDIAAKTRKIVSHSTFSSDASAIELYPVLNVSDQALYYFSLDKQPTGTEGFIYKYTFATKTVEKLFNGMSPYAVNNGVVLYRRQPNNLTDPTDITLFANGQNTVIAEANFGLMPDDNSRVVYLANEIKFAN